MLRRNVLIFQTGGLGDFVLTWPFAVALGRIYPQSRIVYVTNQQKGELARRVLRLEATDIEAGWHGLFAEAGKLPAAGQSILESAHAVYTFLPVSPTWRENVQRLSQLNRCVEIDSRLTAGFTGHLTDRILESLQSHPPERAAMEQILRSVKDRGIGFKPAGGDCVLIHPGSGSREKCWPLDRFIQLASRLKTAGRAVRFVIGEVEQERWTSEDIRLLSQTGTLRRCGTYLELLEEISTAGLFIGNDTGPGHLAGIIGAETISLFGQTVPANWKPLGPRTKVLRAKTLDELAVDDVLGLIK